MEKMVYYPQTLPYRATQESTWVGQEADERGENMDDSLHWFLQEGMGEP